ncbi:AraC family transcriptional regulator [Amycolatopsis alkalitolerans]|uniref:AraC family transcriptional regulator n=1 Tax=Amycolatopsis alkalitolerans TaxID=2547244 RepID=A0A5C4LUA1_9PSEU|nr:AraC family transcriptional regulator [Amycolatopsis alkalitolerans]
MQRYKIFESRDVDDTRERVAKVFCPHTMNTPGRAPRLDAVMHCRRLRNVAMSYVAYGQEVQVDPGELGSFFVVFAPVAGDGVLHCGGQQAHTTPRHICVVTATEALRMRLSGSCRQLVIRIERTALEAQLSAMLDSSLPEPLRFTLDMDTASEPARSWYKLLTHAVSDLDDPESILAHPRAVEQFEGTVMAGLLLTQPHNYTAALLGDERPVPSRLVGTVVDLLEGHPEWAHTPASLARQAGVSVRALQKAFREQLDSSPSEYLRGVRLQRVHDELSVARSDATTVREIASRWGITHDGRFSAIYRERFGEPPRQTLSRRHIRRG